MLRLSNVSVVLPLQITRQNAYAAAGGQTTVRRQVSGTSSSVAFTPLQGLEIVNPHAADTVKQEHKYFSNTLSFKKTS